MWNWIFTYYLTKLGYIWGNQQNNYAVEDFFIKKKNWILFHSNTNTNYFKLKVFFTHKMLIIKVKALKGNSLKFIMHFKKLFTKNNETLLYYMKTDIFNQFDVKKETFQTCFVIVKNYLDLWATTK